MAVVQQQQQQSIELAEEIQSLKMHNAQAQQEEHQAWLQVQKHEVQQAQELLQVQKTEEQQMQQFEAQFDDQDLQTQKQLEHKQGEEEDLSKDAQARIDANRARALKIKADLANLTAQGRVNACRPRGDTAVDAVTSTAASSSGGASAGGAVAVVADDGVG